MHEETKPCWWFAIGRMYWWYERDEEMVVGITSGRVSLKRGCLFNGCQVTWCSHTASHSSIAFPLISLAVGSVGDGLWEAGNLSAYIRRDGITKAGSSAAVDLPFRQSAASSTSLETFSGRDMFISRTLVVPHHVSANSQQFWSFHFSGLMTASAIRLAAVTTIASVIGKSLKDGQLSTNERRAHRSRTPSPWLPCN